ncbi:MAG: transcription antitermination factor NusB [Gemmatimonadetes bacterium]|nr:transcription antitermination factor NusB [Gemmatimonadota bacterium]
MGRRRLGREIAFKALYRIDLLGRAIEDAMADVAASGRDAESIRFAGDLLETCAAHRTEVDGVLEGASTRFGPDRMGVVDRSILRLGATEILYWRFVPDQVSIDEWVEIAKKYGSDEAYALVNAVLDRISRERASGVDT